MDRDTLRVTREIVLGVTANEHLLSVLRYAGRNLIRPLHPALKETNAAMNKAYFATSSTPKFDLLTLFSVVSICALLLGVMRGAGFPPHGILLSSSLLIAVGTARFLLRSSAHPHLAAMAVGFIFTLVCESVLRFVQGLPGGIEVGFVLLAIGYGVFADVLVTASLLVPWGIQRTLTKQPAMPLCDRSIAKQP